MDTYSSLPAVVDGSETMLTYRELDLRVNGVAQYLIHLGALPGLRMAVLQEPGIDWIVSLLAILRIGAVYVPVHLQSPPPRLRTVLKDCSAAFILAHSATFDFATYLSERQEIVVNVSTQYLSTQGISTVSVRPKADWPGLILYTSGTTGVPKGVVLKHLGIVNQTECSSRIFGLGPGSRILQQTAATFDLSVWEVFLALATGGCLVIASTAQRNDPEALLQLIVSEAVTFTLATPSEYAWWFQSDTERSLTRSNWNTAVAGGEFFPHSLVQAFQMLKRPELRIFNAYGPCEVTLFSNIAPVDLSVHTEPLNAGRTIQNMATYIVDEDLKILPVGLPGEIVLAGVGIAERYTSEDETRAKFLPDKWASPEFVSKGWCTMYRTGDRGQIRNDGTLIPLGRISGDTQVKINGQRLELQDIEHNIIQESGGNLAQVAVSVRGNHGAEFLVAYVSFTKGYVPSEQKAYFRNLLNNLPVPQFMRPSLMVALDRLPVTEHFKLDRGAINLLPLPKAMLEEESDDDLSSAARKIKNAWKKVLPAGAFQHEMLNPTSDFFHVGGTSIRLVRLQREIKNVFGTHIPFPSLFQYSTLGAMVDILKTSEAHSVSTSNLIDWAQETAIQYPIPHLSIYHRPQQTPQIIALTGSTGFLGRTLLHHLICHPSISHIHCLCIRGSHSRPLPPLFSSPKVTLHFGDLTSPNLGLPPDALISLLPSLSAIIHNAADTSFMKTYPSLRPVNVASTHEIVRLAMTHRTPIHYISTAGVAHFAQQEVFGPVSVAEFVPPTDGSDGYAASKWASEVVLERVSKAAGMEVWIHRPSSIMGDEMKETDVMGSLWKYAVKMGAVPFLQGEGMKVGVLDLVDVGDVAAGVVKAVVSERIGKDLVRYLHHVGDVVVPIESVEDGVDGELGFEVLALREWIVRARKEGMNELVAEFLGTVEGRWGRLQGEELRALTMFPRLVKGSQHS
jgi:hybrid polyketide synthase/nonribosomal peptide synthetase ACE1